MALEWIHENAPRYDAPKAEIVGGAAAGIFVLSRFEAGQLVPGEWWRVEDAGDVVGYGWMDLNWGDAEILLAVHPERRKSGVGTFILDRLEEEASTHGVNYLYNTVRSTHPDREAITAWLEARRFAKSHDDERLMRRVRART